MERRPRDIDEPLTPAERKQLRGRNVGSIYAERTASQPARLRVDLGKIVTVRSGLGNNRCALYERHPAHPGGEVMIHGEKTFRAAMTPAVAEKVVSGEIVVVKE